MKSILLVLPDPGRGIVHSTVKGTLGSRNDRGYGPFHIGEHTLRRYPRYPESIFLNEACPFGVSLTPIAHVMQKTVDLDRQPRA
jgi:hypothetical protein